MNSKIFYPTEKLSWDTEWDGKTRYSFQYSIIYYTILIW
jgi:hypothetical protein